MIYTKESFEEFKDIINNMEYENNYLEFDSNKLINVFIQYPDILADRRRFLGYLSDLFPNNRRDINLVLLAYDIGIVSEIEEHDLDDILVYRCANMLVKEYGIKAEYAVETICLWCMVYGNGVLKKPFIAKKRDCIKVNTKCDVNMETTIDELGLSARTTSLLKRAGINTVGDMCDRSDRSDDVVYRTMGRKTFDEILNRLRELSFKNE